MNRLSLIITITLLATSLIGGCWSRSLLKKNRQLKEDKQNISSLLVSRDNEIEYVKDKLGQEVAKNELKEVRAKDLNVLINELKDERLVWITQFEGLKKNLKNLEHATQVNTQTVLKFEAKLGDTTLIDDDSIKVKARPFEYREPYFYQSGYVLPDKLRVDSLMVEVPIDGIIYWEKERLFGISFFPKWGKKTYDTQFRSKNPRTTITGLNNIRVTKR